MPDYKEQTVTGKQWQRFNGVYLRNPLGETPSIEMQSEMVVQVGDQRYVTVGDLIKAEFNPKEEIVLMNPETGEPTGASITAGEAYAIVYSFCMMKAAARDAQIEADAKAAEAAAAQASAEAQEK